MPSGPRNLWAATLMAATPRRRKSMRQFAGHRHGVGVQRHAGPVAQRGQFGHRLEHARLVVAQHHADQPRGGDPAAAQAARRGRRRRRSTPRVSSRQPCSSRCSAGSITLACSMAEMTSCPAAGSRGRAAMPRMARLLASVPLLVKIRRSGCGSARLPPRISAIRSPGVFQQAAGLLARADAGWPGWHSPPRGSAPSPRRLPAGWAWWRCGRGRSIAFPDYRRKLLVWQGLCCQ